MPTSLSGLYQRLRWRTAVLDAAFERHVSERARKRRIDRFAFQEGLVSALWQSWCTFCRSTVINSALGATSASGQSVSSPHWNRVEMEIAYIARELSQRRTIVAASVQPLSGNQLEPTWGDLAKLNLIISGLNTTNAPQLLSAFGSALSIRDLQVCRNSSAHINSDRIAQVNSAKVRYSDTICQHPSDMIIWTDPLTRDFLWKTWLDEIDLIARSAVN